jgi:type III restriction enzyme
LQDFVDPKGKRIRHTSGAALNFDVEMETGTGKTYCFVKSIFELNKQYSWSKFIIVVPSIAIREGIYKSLEITAEHFLEDYGKRARFFIYNSKQLHQLESFSSDGGINVMVINVQAFNARGKDARRIRQELDDFQSRRPIDVISANRPIMIMDEPQKMEGKKTLESLAEFNPLFILRYSATHRVERNKVFRLDAVDAYNQKLVKKIGVRGVTTKGLAGTNAYLYLANIEISPYKPPVARIEFEQKLKSGSIKRIVRKLGKGDNLYDLSNGLEQYKDNFVISDINAVTDTMSFLNGALLTVGDAVGDVNESTVRRMQIREAVKAHFDKEMRLYDKGIKVLSLFFIDEVAKYRDYDQPDEKGSYARIFEEEYQALLKEHMPTEGEYREYLRSIDVEHTHNGYFSIDKKSKRLVDPKFKTRGDDAGLANDENATAAYDLILKDKERLLSFEEPTRFIFSHSALREGWDNPNVFVICTLKQSDNTISRRQEVGRGLRLAVNQHGERIDHPSVVHDINRLTVVASESYKDFVGALQKDISASLSARPKVADEKYFTGKVLPTPEGDVEVTPEMAKQVYRYLLKNDYTDDNDRISEAYHQKKRDEQLADLPVSLQPYAELTKLKRRTVAEILGGIRSHVFDQFRNNPEDFFAKAAALINEQKATMVIEHLAYDTIEEKFDSSIFDTNSSQDFSNAGDKLKHHIYDYVLTDSKTERNFVNELDTHKEVHVYAKLPIGFFIPTPLGNYNPDWAIAFQEGAVKHVYFVAETKGSMQSLQLKGAEQAKIDCAKKFFDTVNQKFAEKRVKYGVVDNYENLKMLIH